MLATLARLSLGTLAVLELRAAIARNRSRRSHYEMAAIHAKQTGRTLVVVGSPTNGAWSSAMGPAYGCGEVCVDLAGCTGCPVTVQGDIANYTGVPDDSAVVFVSCVLEYVNDVDAAWREILRMAGSLENVFVVCVQPHTMTSVLYPGARRVVKPNGSYAPVTPMRKAAYATAVGALATLCVV